MLERVLIYIKQHVIFLWVFLEWINGRIFSFLYGRQLDVILENIFKEVGLSPFTFRKLNESDINNLYRYIHDQERDDYKYFNPHGFDMESLRRQIRKRAFLMMGTFYGDELIGYFFLRFFCNRRCFVGRIIAKSYRGKGIGLTMNKIMYETSWRMGFRCFSTISMNNESVVRAHSKNQAMVVRKRLQNEYLLVEFKRTAGDI